MVKRSRPAKHRPLLSKAGLAALIGCALLVLLVLLPFAQGRLHKAVLLAPSSLSIRYLELSLDQHPDDAALRMELAKKLIETGQLDAARRTLVVLTPASSALGSTARLMLIDLDLGAWAAIEPERRDARAAALSRVLADMAALDVGHLPDREVERLAKRYRELDQPLAAAQLFDRRAEHGWSSVTARFADADAAWLAAGLPARAAELHARAASKPGQPRAQGLAHARLALERMRGAGDPDASARMIARMRALYPDDPGLLELAVQMAEEHDVQRAFELAVLLVSNVPAEAKYHRLLARLAEANGRSLRALDEYVWLVRHGGTESDRAHALALAKGNWDLRLYRQLLGGRTPDPPPSVADCKRDKGRCQIRKRTPQRPARLHGRRRCQLSASAKDSAVRLHALRERVALDEALGDAAAARKKLTAAVAGDFGDVRELWQNKFELELRSGDGAAALQTATHMQERFPGRASSERLAGLQLALSQPRAALRTLLHAALTPEERDVAWLRRIALVAFQVGDVAAERDAYDKLIALPDAAYWDYQRALELAPDCPRALRVALAAFERFESPSMLAAAIELYAAEGKEAEQLELLEHAEQIDPVTANVQYWQTRIGYHQRRAVRAIERASYPLAAQQLSAAEDLLERAAKRTPADTRAYEPLWTAQHAQELSLGLASDDVPLIARAYAANHDRLSMRERVYVLRRMHNDDEALAVARSGLQQRGLSAADRRALESEAADLSRSIRRYVGISAEALQMDGLLALSGGAALEYSGDASGLRGQASFTQYRPRKSPDPVIAGEVHDVSAALQGQLGVTALELGARVRDEKSVRPFGTLTVRFLEPGALARLQINELATDTARLRVLGVRDALVLDTSLPLHEHVYASARTAAEMFYTRQERSYLGAGLTVDMGLGVSMTLPADVGTTGIRLVGRLAPRFAHSPPSDVDGSEKSWLPETSEWAGLGASLGRGQLDTPPLFGRRFCYLLDGAVGWLWPASAPGFSAQAGVGVSIAGADLLSLTAHLGNVVGSTVADAHLAYAFTTDR